MQTDSKKYVFQNTLRSCSPHVQFSVPSILSLKSMPQHLLFPVYCEYLVYLDFEDNRLEQMVS